jgi:probable rRNA maturation factor
MELLPSAKNTWYKSVLMNLSKSELQTLLGQIISYLPKKDRDVLSASPQLDSERLVPLQINCVFVDAQRGRMLNRVFRGRDYATDVLSFAPVEPGFIGELIFCTSILRRQAKEHHLSLKNEFLYLFIHGLLHLLGYDHEKSDKAAQRMYRLQDSIFEEMTPKNVKKREKNGSRNGTLRRKK